jgi:glycosyltransferase involved in cell wall biosynthesis
MALSFHITNTPSRPLFPPAGAVDTPDTALQLAAGARGRFALVLWNGDVGGAEVLTISLAERMLAQGHAATVVFVEGPGPMTARLADKDIPTISLGMARGRDVIGRARQFAASVTAHAPDGALLVECGFMGAALRAGGYRGRIVAAEHGAAMAVRSRSRFRREIWRLGRLSGAWADDVEVAVSNFIEAEMRRHVHARRLTCIHNGVDPELYKPATGARQRESRVIGFAARLIAGKGADHLLEAFAALPAASELWIAGDGPERERLIELAAVLGLSDRVRFLGLLHDMARFWRDVDVAAIPSAEFVESCPMTPLEAMATGLPVVATRNGGLPELIVDGVTGTLVAPGDPTALSAALARYIGDPALCEHQGRAGRERVLQRFDIHFCVQSYLGLLGEELAAPSFASPAPRAARASEIA